MMRVVLLMVLLLVTIAGASRAAAPSTLPISVVNYSDLPVYATAVALDEKELCAKLGSPEGSALRLRTANGARVIPITRGIQNGRTYI